MVRGAIISFQPLRMYKADGALHSLLMSIDTPPYGQYFQPKFQILYLCKMSIISNIQCLLDTGSFLSYLCYSNVSPLWLTNSVQMIMLRKKIAKNETYNILNNKSTHMRFRDFQGASNKLFQEIENKIQLVECEC